MTLHDAPGATSVDRLGPEDLIEVFGFLDRDPVLNVYLLALALRDGLSRPRDEYWGARHDGVLVGLLHLGARSGAALPVAADPAIRTLLAERAVERLAVMPRRFQIIGEREPVYALVAALRERGPAPRILRDQLYMNLERDALAPFERLPALRRATREDVPVAFASGADMRAEELEEDPRVADPAGYARRVEEECRDGYTFLWFEGPDLCFRASVSAMTPDSAQISGVYTPPGLRNRGIARRGLSELCARLFERSRTVCLFVNDFNAPALALYRRMGFRDHAAWASAFYDRRRDAEPAPE